MLALLSPFIVQSVLPKTEWSGALPFPDNLIYPACQIHHAPEKQKGEQQGRSPFLGRGSRNIGVTISSGATCRGGTWSRADSWSTIPARHGAPDRRQSSRTPHRPRRDARKRRRGDR